MVYRCKQSEACKICELADYSQRQHSKHAPYTVEHSFTPAAHVWLHSSNTTAMLRTDTLVIMMVIVQNH